jgi:hypothetical protein
MGLIAAKGVDGINLEYRESFASMKVIMGSLGGWSADFQGGNPFLYSLIWLWFFMGGFGGPASLTGSVCVAVSGFHGGYERPGGFRPSRARAGEGLFWGPESWQKH